MGKKLNGILFLLIGVLALFLVFREKGPEETAKKFIKSMMDANAKRCISMMTDDAVEKIGETRKIAIHNMEEALEALQEDYRYEYGDNWECKVVVIDFYEATAEYYDGDYVGEAVVVVLELQHEASGLFWEETGEETETLILVKEGRKWLISGFGF